MYCGASKPRYFEQMESGVLYSMTREKRIPKDMGSRTRIGYSSPESPHDLNCQIGVEGRVKMFCIEFKRTLLIHH